MTPIYWKIPMDLFIALAEAFTIQNELSEQ